MNVHCTADIADYYRCIDSSHYVQISAIMRVENFELVIASCKALFIEESQVLTDKNYLCKASFFDISDSSSNIYSLVRNSERSCK